VLDAIGEDVVVRWVLEAARAPRVQELASEGAAKGAVALLDRPIGRPARFVGEDTAARLATVVGPALWQWLERELPKFVEQFDIPGMVERKVLGFSTARIEEIIRAVTQRELTMIVNLGYLLGAIIGVVTMMTMYGAISFSIDGRSVSNAASVKPMLEPIAKPEKKVCMVTSNGSQNSVLKS
jgi:uncharacterized membrane protein YheB (UPF0754 family)